MININSYCTPQLSIHTHSLWQGSGGATVLDQTTYYYPYGMPMAESTSPEANRYKYTAKELFTDSRLNLADHGARMYDPAIGRWISQDPLSAKYPDMSHYLFCANNPINYIDPEGEEGVRIIDNEKKTITIKANYYVVTGDAQYRENGVLKSVHDYTSNDIKDMNSYNDYLNSLDLKVSKGEYSGYDVKFDLTFIDGGEAFGDAYSSASMDTFEGHPIGNTIQRGTKDTHRNVGFEITYNKYGQPESIGGGGTVYNKNIIMNISLDSKENRLHEIFHTFGFKHRKGGGSQGIMKYPPDEPSKKDANTLSNIKYLPSIIKQ